MANQEFRIDFVDGPSREDLFLALRLQGEGRIVTFTGSDGKKYGGSVLGLEWEDGSGDCWNIKGYLMGTMHNRSVFFKGFFRTSSPRKGHGKYTVDITK